MIMKMMKIKRTLRMWLNYDSDKVNLETMLVGQQMCRVTAGSAGAYM